MKITRSGFTGSVIRLLCIALMLIGSNVHAVTGARAEKWEFFLAPQYTNAKVLQFDGGAEADINARQNLGFGFGYNLDSNIELSVLFAASSGNYTGTRIADDASNTPEKFSASMYTSVINFGFTYNFLKQPFTPYISANLGSTYIDSGIPTGNIGSVCWWDPWYGYICTPTAQTYTSSNFTYGASVGLRYDFNGKVYIKGGVGQNYVDVNSSNTPDFTTYHFIFGLMF
ncbi:MAG: outer membrane beta-barrel protein [Gammaproteobacteria bacterium]|nr:outer membrane beta-barrel protein [Gammaproteobacteria bacterium]